MSEDSFFVCCECAKSVAKSDLRGHLSAHLHYYRFQCGRCFSRFVSRDKLQLHAELSSETETKCLPIDVVEDPDAAKERELRQLLQSCSTANQPSPSLSTQNISSPVVVSSPVPATASKGPDPIPATPRPLETRKTPSADSCQKMPVKEMKSTDIECQTCALCGENCPVNFKYRHVMNEHVQKIRAGEEESPHGGKQPKQIYLAIRLLCFPYTPQWLSSSRKKRDSSNFYITEVKPETTPRTKSSLKCRKCGEVLGNESFKRDHCKKHVTQIMKKRKRDCSDEKFFNQIFFAMRKEWFPDTVWGDRLHEELQDGPKLKFPRLTSECGKCGEDVPRSDKSRHCKKHVTELMKKSGKNPADQTKFNQLYFANRNKWFPYTDWAEKEPKTRSSQSGTKQNAKKGNVKKDSQVQSNKQDQATSSTGHVTRSAGEEQPPEEDDKQDQVSVSSLMEKESNESILPNKQHPFIKLEPCDQTGSSKVTTSASKASEVVSTTFSFLKRKTPSATASKEPEKNSNHPSTTEKCGLCGFVSPADMKAKHVNLHTQRIRNGVEFSPHIGKPFEEIYSAIRLRCFKDVPTWLHSNLNEDLSNSDKDEDEPKTEGNSRFKCRKCGEVVRGSTMKRRHCKRHVTEMMKQMGKDPADETQFNQIFYDKRKEWFPDTQWEEEKKLGMARSKCQKCGTSVRKKSQHCKNHVTKLMREAGKDPGNMEEFNQIFFAKRSEWFPYTEWRIQPEKTLVRQDGSQKGDRESSPIQKNSNPSTSGLGDSSTTVVSSHEISLEARQAMEEEQLSDLLNHTAEALGDQQLLEIKLEPQDWNIFDTFKKGDETPGKSSDSLVPTMVCGLCRESMPVGSCDGHVWREHCDGQRQYGCTTCPFLSEDFGSARSHVTRGHPGAEIRSDNEAMLIFSVRKKACFPDVN